MHGLFGLNVIIPFKIKVIEKPHTIFKLQKEVLKFDYICVSWNSPKTDLVTIFWIQEIEVLRMFVFLNSNILVNIWHSFT